MKFLAHKRIVDLCTRKLTYLQIFLWVSAVITIRVLLEWEVFVFVVYINVFQDYVRFYLENMYYFLILFTVGTVFISRVSGVGLRQVMNFCARLYAVIIIPPIIDGMILGLRGGYEYCQLDTLLVNFLTLSGGGDGPVGILIEVVVGLAGAAVYVYKKTRSFLKAIGTVLFLDLFLLILSTPDIFFGRGGGDYFFDWFLPLFYYIPFIVLLAGLLFFYDKKRLSALLRNVRVVRSAAFIGAVALGGVWTFWVYGAVHIWNAVLAACAAFFVWEASVMINDLHDLEIDRISNPSRPLLQNRFQPAEFNLIACIYVFLALSFAAVTTGAVCVLTVFCVILAYAYSVPPVRLRKTLWGAVVIGSAIVVSFLIGIAATGGFTTLAIVHRNTRAVLYAVLLFLIGTLIPLVKDIKDIEGDRQNRIKNLFTLYGKKQGKKLTALFMFLAFGFSYLVIGSFDPVVLILSSTAVIVFYRFESIKGVYAIAMIIAFRVLQSLANL